MHQTFLGTMFSSRSTFLFVNAVLSVSFFGFALEHAVSFIQGLVYDWERVVILAGLFCVCLIGFLDYKNDQN